MNDMHQKVRDPIVWKKLIELGLEVVSPQKPSAIRIVFSRGNKCGDRCVTSLWLERAYKRDFSCEASTYVLNACESLYPLPNIQ